MLAAFRVRTFGAPTILASLSQLLGLVQLYLLMADNGSGRASDVYFLVLTWSLLPSQIILQGVAYAGWLRLGTSEVASGGRMALSTAALSLVCGGFASLAYGISEGEAYSYLVIGVVQGIAGAVFSLVFASALQRSATGDPLLLSCMTLPGSVVACLALISLPPDLYIKVIAIIVSSTIGSIILLILDRRRVWSILQDSARPSPRQPREEGHYSTSGRSWFAMRSVTGYASGSVLQSVGAVLPPSSLTVANVCSRFVSGFNTVVTNSVLPRLVNYRDISTEGATRFSWILVCGGLLALTATPVVSVSPLSNWASEYAACVVWAVSAGVSASAQRVSTKVRSPAWASISIVVSCVVPVAAICLVAMGIPMSAIALLSMYISLEVLNSCLYLVLLRERLLALIVILYTAVGMGFAWNL